MLYVDLKWNRCTACCDSDKHLESFFERLCNGNKTATLKFNGEACLGNPLLEQVTMMCIYKHWLFEYLNVVYTGAGAMFAWMLFDNSKLI
jgi:hypothetical protein